MPNSTRKVLIVSPHFPPVNAPDMQRTRLALPYLRESGWEPVVLAVDPSVVEGAVIEPLLEETYPADIRIVRVRGVAPRATRWLGIGSLWLRCGSALSAAGAKLLQAERFDLVFFSTTQFDAFTLGPEWKKRFGVPYVLDYQDPWINNYYKTTGTRPPGGWIKYGFSQWSARRREPGVVRGASGLIAVSEAYFKSLEHAYPWLDRARLTVLTFGAAKADLVTARKHTPLESLVPFGDGHFHHVYTGRCGPDMSKSLTIVFRAFKIFLKARPSEAARVRFHFIGTDYAPRPLGREWAMPVARAEGVEAYVTEHCYRVPYFDALYYLTRADALLGVGSNDPTYSASKIYPYVLAMRPILLIFNHLSPVLSIASKLKSGLRFAFDDERDIDALIQKVADEWFINGKMYENTPPDLEAFLPYTAEGMTRTLAGCFDDALRVNAATA